MRISTAVGMRSPAFSLASGRLAFSSIGVALLAACGQDAAMPTPTPVAIRAAYLGGDAGVQVASIDPDSGRLSVIQTVAFGHAAFMAIDNRRRFLFVCEPFDRLWAFTIDPRTALLDRVPEAPFRLPCYRQLSPDARGRFLYLASEAGIDVYAVDAATGALAVVPGSPFSLPDYAVYVAAEPSGAYIYAPMPGASAIAAFAVEETGVLREVRGSPFRATAGALLPALDLNGRRMYVLNSARILPLNSIWSFSVNVADGRLEPLPFRLEAEEDFWPVNLRLDPLGQFAYVEKGPFPGAYRTFRVEADGRLTRAPAPDVRPPGTFSNLVIEPLGRFAYVAEAETRTYHVFRIDRATGALTELGPAITLPAGLGGLVFAP